MADRISVGNNGAEGNYGDGWRKSSYSMSNGQCIEISRLAAGHIGVRDSKTIEGPVLRFEPGAWTAFLAGLRTSLPS